MVAVFAAFELNPVVWEGRQSHEISILNESTGESTNQCNENSPWYVTFNYAGILWLIGIPLLIKQLKIS